MFKQSCFLTSFVLLLWLASISYGPPVPISLDFDDASVVVTEPGFTSFLLSNSGTTVGGITIDLSGNLLDRRRANPVQIPPIIDDLYRDFIFGIPPSGVTITLWGLGYDQYCDITIYAFDDESLTPRLADWTANGDPLFTTEFEGGFPNWPGFPRKYAFSGTAVADILGRIILESTRNPGSPEGQPFAFVNGIEVTPLGIYVPSEYDQRPVPFDGTEDVLVDAILEWIDGPSSIARDVYLGTDYDNVADANRIFPMGVLVSLNQVPNTFDPYGAMGFLKLDTTYYWRVDEVNVSGIPQWIGEVWSFTTKNYHEVDNFNSYANHGALRAVWEDFFTQPPPITSAEVYVETTTVRDGKSMRYWYRNDLPPYYSEARASTAALGIDPDWESMGAEALSLWFYGQAGNPVSEKMYVKLTDGDNPAMSAKVIYPDMNDINEPEWHEWNIALQDFVDTNDVNLANVAEITISFEEGSYVDGTVFFEDVRLYARRCALEERSADFARVDYSPGGDPAGDCVVDYQELEIMANSWLIGDAIIETIDPCTNGLVAYWPMNAGAGVNVNTSPPNPLYNGIFSGPGVSWVTPGVPLIGGVAAISVDGSDGSMVSIGTANPTGGANAITLAIWAKWAGPTGVSQGLIGKMDTWSANGLMFIFECDSRPNNKGSFALRQYSPPNTDVYSSNNILDGFIGQWSHLAATFDGNTAKLYLNGGEVASGPFSFGNGTAASMAIGNTNGASGSLGYEVFNGDLDEARIYNRALEPNEIAYLADTTPADGVQISPVPSAAEIWMEEAPGERIVNFRDFVFVADKWLAEDLFP